MLKILDLNDNALEVEVIRYFRLNSKNYFMYTLNEADEQNYLKLYALRVTDNLQGEKIAEDSEWSDIKDYIKVIIKGNKDGNATVEDLNFEELKNLKISETRAFKLSAQMVDLLKANKKEFPVETFDAVAAMEEMTIEPIQSAFDMTLPEEVVPEPAIEPVLPVIEEVTPDPVSEMFGAPYVAPAEAEFELPNQVLPTTEFEFPAVEAPAAMPEAVSEVAVEEPVFPVFEPLTEAPVVPEPVLSTEQFVADYSFEQEDDMMETPEVAEITPIVITPLEEKEEVNTDFDNEFKLLYEEEKALTEVLKNEISELREKLGKITQILSQ